MKELLDRARQSEGVSFLAALQLEVGMRHLNNNRKDKAADHIKNFIRVMPNTAECISLADEARRLLR